jgi:DNA mismatch endonuclease (patch repair protein)
MRGNRKENTKPEVRLRSVLHRRGLRFFKNARPERGIPCRVDIVFPRARLAVFVDGCFWHRCPEHGTAPRTNARYWSAKIARNVERDRENDKLLAESGWQVIRVWEHESVAAAADRVEQALGGGGGD